MEETSLRQMYLQIYLGINRGFQFEKNGDYKAALGAFSAASAGLVKIHQSNPDWEAALVLGRLRDTRSKIRELQPMLGSPLASASDQKPGASAASTDTSDSVFQILAQLPSMKYPWKTDILPTLFWIGEDSNGGSAWVAKWKQDNGGADSPGNRAGYFPRGHASTLNPFYVALPFNDLAFPDQARMWMPVSWERPVKDGKQVSACKDRWIEIKNEQGRVCYAQWEDVGPLGGDHAEYVFGNARPGSPTTPGISVSPAVADYLSLAGNKSLVRWRFVDNANVSPGMWLKYDEEALMFAALHQVTKSDALAGPGK